MVMLVRGCSSTRKTFCYAGPGTTPLPGSHSGSACWLSHLAGLFILSVPLFLLQCEGLLRITELTHVKYSEPHTATH